MNNTTPDSSSNMVMIERSSNPDRSFSRVDQVDLAIKNTANINESSSPSPESQTQLIQNMIVNGNEVVRQNATIPVNPASKPVIIPPVDEVALKFIFANLDGTNVQITVPLMSTAHQVKLALLANWPENVERMNDGRRLRLLCMGKELNTSTNLKITLKQMNIPRFQFHPTPVNVSIIPAGIDPSKTRSGIRNSGKRSFSTAQASRGGCCIVS